MRCEVAWLSLVEGSKNLPSGWQRRELSADCFKGRNDNDYKLRWGEREGGARIQGCVDKFLFSLDLSQLPTHAKIARCADVLNLLAMIADYSTLL